MPAANKIHRDLEILNTALQKADVGNRATLESLEARIAHAGKTRAESSDQMAEISKEYSTRFRAYHQLDAETTLQKIEKDSERKALVEQAKIFHRLMKHCLSSGEDPPMAVMEAQEEVSKSFAEVLRKIQELQLKANEAAQKWAALMQKKADAAANSELDEDTILFYKDMAKAVAIFKEELGQEKADGDQIWAQEIEELKEKQARLPTSLCQTDLAKDLREKQAKLEGEQLKLTTNAAEIGTLFDEIGKLSQEPEIAGASIESPPKKRRTGFWPIVKGMLGA